MSESSSVNNNGFRFEIGRVSEMPNVDNKKEKFIYEYLLKDYQKTLSSSSNYYNFFALLDQEEGTRGVITRGDINIFLSSKAVQKKNITEEDVIDFLNKVTDLNDTKNVNKRDNKEVTDNMSSFFGLGFSKDSDYNKLKELNIKDNAKNQVVTPEILALFENGVTEVKFDAMLNSDGSLKPGLELFDLNGDGKIDDLEKSYFSSGGHAISDDSSKLTLKSLLNALENLDRFGTSGKNFQEYDKADGRIYEWDSKHLYMALTSANYLLDTMKNSKELFPKDVYNLYEKALKEVRLGEIDLPRDPSKKGRTWGIHLDDFVGVDYSTLDKFEVAGILFHELTHHVLCNDKKLNVRIAQEVETFYMEYKLYESERNNPEYKKAKKKAIPMQENYFWIIDRMKKENPNISEKDLAIEAFIEECYENYENKYKGEAYTPDQLRALVKKTDKYIMLK